MGSRDGGLTLIDQFGTRQQVQIGKARLVCTPTSEATVDRGPVLNPDFDTASQTGFPDHIKCYDALSKNDHGSLAE